MRRALQNLPCEVISLACSAAHLLSGDPLLSPQCRGCVRLGVEGLVHLANERGAGRQRLKASTATTGARRAVGVQTHVADLARQAVCPSMEQAIEDEAASDARADGDIEHILTTATRPIAPLAQCPGVGVVLQHGGRMKTVGDMLPQGKPLPARHVVARARTFSRAIHRSIKADANGGGLEARLRQLRVSQR